MCDSNQFQNNCLVSILENISSLDETMEPWISRECIICQLLQSGVTVELKNLMFFKMRKMRLKDRGMNHRIPLLSKYIEINYFWSFSPERLVLGWDVTFRVYT